MRRSLLVLGVAVLAAPGSAAAQEPGGPVDRTPGPAEAVIVRFEEGATATQRGAARREAGVRRREGLPLTGAEVAVPREGQDVEGAVARLAAMPGVRYAEPDQPRVALREPRDPLYPRLYGLPRIGAPAAWDITTGGEVLVAIIDTGIDLGHPGLIANLWSNPGEAGPLAANGIDDDASGVIDDVRGADLVQIGAQPYDGNGHGTHVAGTVAATGDDGIGTTGVAWRAQLAGVRVLGDDGTGYASDVIEGYRYAARIGARVANVSLGGDAPSRAERDALAGAPGVLFVAAAGNEGRDLDAGESYPCEYDLPNVVCVAASDADDALATFSNTGANVDLAAPGVAIGSTWPGGRHVLLDGTSMAAPHVSGAAVLALARDPSLTPGRLADLLRRTADPLPGAGGRVAAGRLDAAGLVAALGDPAPTAGAGQASSGEAEPAPGAEEQPAPASPPSPALEPAPTAPASAVDTRAPGLGVTAPSSLRRTSLARPGLALRVRCSEGCRVRAELRRGTRRVARLTTSRATQGTLRRRLRARTAAGRLTLVVTATDAAGNARTRRVAVRVR